MLPSGQFLGNHHGKHKAKEIFAFVSKAFPKGIHIRQIDSVTAEGDRGEFEGEGELRGKPYEKLVAISLDVCGEKICGYREYCGLVGLPPAGE
ncbi:MAG: hypothetical protein K0U98_07790 [Deltaproteobacteria bacterium]|nr:hypothetical protein [Deltaproteobacteria bacterium]